MFDTLLTTKTIIPPTKPILVKRPRLETKINECIQQKLLLISAPAGFGKTTLIASCINNIGISVAWLSLDKNDNQIERFLIYLIAAIHKTDSTFGERTIQLMQGLQVNTETILISLINEMNFSKKETILVLDDYQFITNREIHELVIFIIENCPGHFHLTIASRSDPPFPLARLRARGQLVELRTADLRFNDNETNQFLNDLMQLDLEVSSVALLEKRTEGWITGLQMAALSLQNRENKHEFIVQFSGTHRFILDYLLEEVLANQTPEIQRFLLNTSILIRFTAPLCDAVMKKDKIDVIENNPLDQPVAGLSNHSASCLDYLENTNLFLVPLDEERTWYRYHHLFADLLQARLQQTCDSKELSALHSKAAKWYENNNLTFEALHHASITEDNVWVERLIEKNFMEIFQRRNSAFLSLWTGELSKELIFKRPGLCIHAAMTRCWLGELDEAELLLNEAEKHFQSEPSTVETRAIKGQFAYVKSRITAMRGDFPGAIDLCLEAKSNTPESNQALLGGIGVMLGYGYFLNGDFLNAIKVLEETIQAGITARAINSTIGAYCVLARLYKLHGELGKALTLYREAQKLIETSDFQHQGAMSIVEMGLADIMYERNMLQDAQTHIERGLQNVHLWGKADDVVLALATATQIHQSLGEIDVALETIEKGIKIVHSSGLFPEAQQVVETTNIRLQLVKGDPITIRQWVNVMEKDLDQKLSFCYNNELSLITLARVYLVQGKFNRCIKLLERMEFDSQLQQRKDRVIKSLIIKALAFQKMGKMKQAISCLEKSLFFAEKEGYSRPFLDEGRVMHIMLSRWLASNSENKLKDYVVYLLIEFENEPKTITETTEKSFSKDSSKQALIDPISQRELEVLQLMAQGKTNPQIAEELVVARGTVKAHTANIFRKLDVANRTEAAARARELGIIF
ncbi:MAG: hypothetical protein CL609_01200 [Anaerolineaceae bacterium]|nr:hypothetical protein [Anaerolineaceae bacterium]